MQACETNSPLLNHRELEALHWHVLEREHHQQHAVAASYSGPFRSNMRGHGMELHDSRPYQTGDDIRHIDWRATARSGKPTTKVFVEERCRNSFIVIDRQRSMQFGTRRELKVTTAARATAILIFSALAARESVAGIVIDEAIKFFPPALNLHNVFPLIQAVIKPPAQHANNQSKIDIEFLLESINHHISPGSSLFLLSDFCDYEKTHIGGLKELSRHHESMAIRIIDRAEEVLTNSGKIRIAVPGTQDSAVIDTSDPFIRKQYADNMADRHQALHNIFIRSDIKMETIYTDQDTFDQLNERL
ncbi:MAG: DUF58 domain-containing protein [Gammaproteobacteria bacterium]